MRLKQLCTRKVRDFAMALRARKVSGAFEKRPPGLEHGPLASGTSALTIRPLRLHEAPRLSGQTPIFGSVFFVSEPLLGIERQKKL